MRRSVGLKIARSIPLDAEFFLIKIGTGIKMETLIATILLVLTQMTQVGGVNK